MTQTLPADVDRSPAARRRPEVLAPAGNREMMRAAIENGADAVYFGLHAFNARLRAANFGDEELPEIMAWLHERGVRGYVTLNTLVFVSEIAEATRTLRLCSDAGVDAILVQDLGLAALAHRLVPGLPIHASTQMTLTCAESVRGAEALGLRPERVVAPRELSRRELERMTAGTDREIEAFVHGALCVAYSGQCLTSEALGGRSANRGECAQACRLPYDLIVDDAPRDTGDLKYLLSPKDLAAFEDIGDLARIGIASLKIEGRLKSPEYVAATVQSYRAAVNQALATDGDFARPRMDAATRNRLEMTFSRGFTGGYVHAIDHQAVVEGRFPKKRGLYLGRVESVTRDGRVGVALEAPLKPGDGVVFDAGRPDQDEQGGRVFKLYRGAHAIPGYDPGEKATTPASHVLSFPEGSIDARRVRPGDRVWKTSDPALDAELRASFSEDRIHHRRPLTAHVRGRVGEPLELTLVDESGVRVVVQDTAPADAARNRPLTIDVLRDQLGRMGNTPFDLGALTADLEGDLLVPFSRLNDLRRDAVERLIARRRERGHDRAIVECALETWRAEAWPTLEPTPEVARLSVLCRSLEQIEAALAFGGVETIYTDFEDIRLHREARALIPRTGGPRFAPATLRIVKPGEAAFVRILLKSEPDAVLVRGLAAWEILRREAPGLELIGDYALNVANDLTARLLLEHGLRRLVPSYDLNIEQLLDMVRATPPALWEATLHQYMPMFHMEHCVFCRFLSDGTDFTNCGRPCETHTVALRDRVGYAHPVKADAGCRNTVFNAVAQSGSAYLPEMLAAGVRRFRIDFLTENAARVRETLEAYAPAVRGETDGRELWRRLRATSKLGVTRGPLDAG